jgi:hypothetical protein
MVQEAFTFTLEQLSKLMDEVKNNIINNLDDRLLVKLQKEDDYFKYHEIAQLFLEWRKKKYVCSKNELGELIGKIIE